MDHIRLNFDGACDNNSKFNFMGIGVAVWVNKKRQLGLDTSLFLGSGTSNIAEWSALMVALRLADGLSRLHADCVIDIYGDSQIIVNQFTGKFQVHNPVLYEYFQRSVFYKDTLETLRVIWIPREQNGEADELSKKALIEYLNTIL